MPAIKYLVSISKPHTHMVAVQIALPLHYFAAPPKLVEFFLPSWSPGSYLMREYSRHVRSLTVQNQAGEPLACYQTAKGTWEINLPQLQTNAITQIIEISYEVYCHEVSVRTSYIDNTHAFLHGPSYLMGLTALLDHPCEIEFRFPALWSKISTALAENSNNQNLHVFSYTAKNYDVLVDTPVEIGCHETDGFKVQNVAHHLAFYGMELPHKNNLKLDIQKIVATVVAMMRDIPYESYLFITHFLPQAYGGLEHLNSTVLHFDGRKLGDRKEYLQYLALVAHEFFHTWNVKRIRPVELGPFQYTQENYTRMLWLAEGMTKFFDDLMVYQAGLSSAPEYLDFLKNDLNQYLKTPGRKFDSLEDSSFNAWIKLYRPHENSNNVSISYYLKGGICFLLLHLALKKEQKSLFSFVQLLWQDFLARPERGLDKKMFFTMLQNYATPQIATYFEDMVSTTHDIDFVTPLMTAGVEVEWESVAKYDFSCEWEFREERVFVKSVLLDGAAHQAGLNAGDEVIFLNGMRLLKSDLAGLMDTLLENQRYILIVSRQQMIQTVEIIPMKKLQLIKKLEIKSLEQFQKCFTVN